MGSNSMTPTPPPGYELDNAGGFVPPPPPPGYELDNPGDKGDYWGDVRKNAIGELKGMADPQNAISNFKMLDTLTKPAFGEIPKPDELKSLGRGLYDTGKNMVQGMSQTLSDPKESFRQRPIGTVGDVATIFGGAAGLAERAAPAIASVADAGAMGLGRRALGFSKRFLNTDGKEVNADAATRTALDNGIIQPLSTPESMKSGAQDLQQRSGDTMGQTFHTANQPPIEPEVMPEQGPQRLLNAPRGPQTMQGPQGVMTSKEVPAYGGPGQYGYKAAGEGPQFNAQEGPMSRRVNTPETFDKGALNDARSGKLGSDYPEPKRLFSEPPSADWLFDPKQALSDLETLRPKTKSGQVLKGGDYTAQNEAIDNAIETIKAHGNKPIPWDQANQLKGDLQGLVNYDTTKSKGVNRLREQIAAKFKDNLDSQLENNMQNSDNGFSIFKRAKGDFKASKDMQKSLQNRISSEKGNNAIGLGDYAAGTAGGAMGGPIGGLAIVGAKKLFQKYGATAGAYGLNKIAGAARNVDLSGPAMDAAKAVGTAGVASKALTADKAKEYLRKAGGDKDAARKMATADGWTF